MTPETQTLTVKVHRSAMERLRVEAAMNEVSLSEWVRIKLGITPQELVQGTGDSGRERFDEIIERRLSRLEEMAGL